MNARNSALVSYNLVPVEDPQGFFDVVGQKWADADVEHAAEWLRQLASSTELRARLGAAAATDVHAMLSPERFARTVGELVSGKA